MGGQAGAYHAVILGAGPAGMGPLICAAQRGGLDALLAKGIAVVDRRPVMGAGSLGRFHVNADSYAVSFLECLEAPAAAQLFAPVGRFAVTQRLQSQRGSHVPLHDVARYLDHLGRVLAQRLAAQSASRFFSNTEACCIHVESSGWLRIRIRPAGERAETELRSRAVVMALGGGQPLPRSLHAELAPGLSLADCGPRRVMLSHDLLTRSGLAIARGRLRANAASRAAATVVILGGSHSAFAAAWALLHGPPAHDCPALAEEAILILHRSPIRIFYPSREAAHQDGYRDFSTRDICPVTERVHRLGGLRGDGRQLGRQLMGLGRQAAERRVLLLPLATLHPLELRALIQRAALVVPALGYRPCLIPIWGPDGQEIRLGASEPGRPDAPLVDSHCRVLDRRGVAVPGLYALGLGTGFLPWGAMGGEPSFLGHTSGVWLYQNDIGALVLDQLEGPREGVFCP